MNLSTILSGLAVGAGFGFVLQRGRFCLNTALRNALYIKEFTLLRAYILALLSALLGANLLEHIGLLHLSTGRQDAALLADIVGGFVFGIGMVLAGGDGGGTWTRTGEGLVGSWMAVCGFLLGTASAKSGFLSGMVERLNSTVQLRGAASSLSSLLGLNKWALIIPLLIAGLVFVFAGKKMYAKEQAGYSWRATGFLVGALIVLGMLIAELMTGRASGVNIPGPTADLLASTTSNKQADWGVALVAGIPAGAFISAWSMHEFSWRAPRADVMAQQLGGGLLMGVGGVTAGGCSIGHGLTGLASLSVASVVSMTGIVLGCWIMVYLLFVRPEHSS